MFFDLLKPTRNSVEPQYNLDFLFVLHPTLFTAAIKRRQDLRIIQHRVFITQSIFSLLINPFLYSCLANIAHEINH